MWGQDRLPPLRAPSVPKGRVVPTWAARAQSPGRGLWGLQGSTEEPKGNSPGEVLQGGLPLLSADLRLIK